MATGTPALPVETVGGYEILEKIADGGMSTVYRARDPESGKCVAIKVIAEAMAANPVWRKRFQQEYRTARKIRHRHLVRGLDFGEENGRPYLVMEFVEGMSLGDLVEREGAVAEDEALRIIGQIAQALDQAHRRGVIHRDVKPDNVLLDNGGQAKLSDLGLVKDTGEDMDLTRPHIGLGTVNFMAPEQYADAKHVDQRADVYSLAATLYFALTGRMPFQGRTDLHLLKKKMAWDIVPARQFSPTLSPQIDQAILQALHPDPGQRPATCNEFLAHLTLAEMPAARLASKRVHKPQADERRTTVRYPTNMNGACRTVGDEEMRYWFARVQNISGGGLNLLMRRRFEPGTILAIELQDRVGRAKRTALVRIVRAHREERGRWSLGCVFHRGMTDEEARELS